MADNTTKPNCPFYGRHATLVRLRYGASLSLVVRFLDSGGNQCGLVTRAYHPCDLFVERQPVDWRSCSAWLNTMHLELPGN